MNQKYRIAIASMGSRGDVYPMLALGRGLVERGHDVVFATPNCNREMVLREGMKHRMLRPDPRITAENPLVQDVDPTKVGTEFALRELIYPYVEETYHDLLSAAKDAEILIFPMFIFPGPMAAERLGIPWAVVHCSPSSFNSYYDPPYLPPAPWLYPFQRMTSVVPRVFNAMAKVAIRSWSAPLHALRAREGFPEEKRDLVLEGMPSPPLTLAFFSSCLGEEQKDWPKPVVSAGFLFYEEDGGEESEAALRFLDAGPPPLVVALGSAVSVHRRGFFETSVEAARKLGKRVLLIAGPDAAYLQDKFDDETVLVVDYIPYSLVFSRACAVVVSGSVGPISHGLRAAKPMLVVSTEFAADQPDNALRSVRMGSARWRPIDRYHVDAVVKDLQALLSDHRYARNAERVAKEVSSQDGVVSACESIESTVRNYKGEAR